MVFTGGIPLLVRQRSTHILPNKAFLLPTSIHPPFTILLHLWYHIFHLRRTSIAQFPKGPNLSKHGSRNQPGPSYSHIAHSAERNRNQRKKPSPSSSERVRFGLRRLRDQIPTCDISTIHSAHLGCIHACCRAVRS